MATLTAPEKTHIRAMSGDDCTPYEVSDEYMQWLHDERASLAPLCMASDPLGGTIVWVLRARVAKAAKLYDEQGEGNAGSVSQKRANLEKDLARWETMCGLSGGVVTISTLDTGMDSDRSDSENASRPYGYLYGLWGGS